MCVCVCVVTCLYVIKDEIENIIGVVESRDGMDILRGDERSVNV